MQCSRQSVGSSCPSQQSGNLSAPLCSFSARRAFTSSRQSQRSAKHMAAHAAAGGADVRSTPLMVNACTGKVLLSNLSGSNLLLIAV